MGRHEADPGERRSGDCTEELTGGELDELLERFRVDWKDARAESNGWFGSEEDPRP